MCSVVAGVIGSHVVLRGMAFIGDAVAHSVFPGLAVAFLMQGSLLLGGSIAGLTTAILVAVVSQNRRLKEDSVIGILFVGAFALGIVIISRAPGYSGSLQQFLFGSITGITDDDIVMVCVAGALVLAWNGPSIRSLSPSDSTVRRRGPRTCPCSPWICCSTCW